MQLKIKDQSLPSIPPQPPRKLELCASAGYQRRAKGRRQGGGAGVAKKKKKKSHAKPRRAALRHSLRPLQVREAEAGKHGDRLLSQQGFDYPVRVIAFVLRQFGR